MSETPAGRASPPHALSVTGPRLNCTRGRHTDTLTPSARSLRADRHGSLRREALPEQPHAEEAHLGPLGRRAHDAAADDLHEQHPGEVRGLPGARGRGGAGGLLRAEGVFTTMWWLATFLSSLFSSFCRRVSRTRRRRRCRRWRCQRGRRCPSRCATWGPAAKRGGAHTQRAAHQPDRSCCQLRVQPAHVRLAACTEVARLSRAAGSGLSRLRSETSRSEWSSPLSAPTSATLRSWSRRKRRAAAAHSRRGGARLSFLRSFGQAPVAKRGCLGLRGKQHAAREGLSSLCSRALRVLRRW